MNLYAKDGRSGPVVDRISVVTKGYIIGQERRSEEWDFQEKQVIKNPTEAQASRNQLMSEALTYKHGCFESPCVRVYI